jgi:hypothetical protein
MKNCLLLTLTFLSAVPVAWSADDPRRPAAIEAQDVPVVPPELAARLAQYQSVRGAAFRGWAPDGTGVLISTRFGNSSQLHRVYEPGGRREQITFFDEPVSGTFIPKGTDGAILMSMDSGGNENNQVLLLDRFRYQSILLTDGKSRNQLGAIRHDGSLMAITSNQRNGRDIDIYLASPRQPGPMKMLMQVEKETWNVHDWSHDGKSLLISRYVSINEVYPAVLDVETGKRTDIQFPVKGKFAAGPMAFTADDHSILIAMDAQHRRRFWKLRTKSTGISAIWRSNQRQASRRSP